MDLNAPKLTQRIEINVWSTDQFPDTSKALPVNDNVNICATCGQPATLENEEAWDEYRITEMCTSCLEKR